VGKGEISLKCYTIGSLLRRNECILGSLWGKSKTVISNNKVSDFGVPHQGKKIKTKRKRVQCLPKVKKLLTGVDRFSTGDRKERPPPLIKSKIWPAENENMNSEENVRRTADEGQEEKRERTRESERKVTGGKDIWPGRFLGINRGRASRRI